MKNRDLIAFIASPLIVLSIVGLLIFLITRPYGDYRVFYRSVTDKDHASPWDEIIRTETPSEAVRKFIIKDGKLYLERLRTKSTLYILTYAGHTLWSNEEISAFRKAHPELEKYWPEPRALNGGLFWQRKTN